MRDTGGQIQDTPHWRTHFEASIRVQQILTRDVWSEFCSHFSDSL